MFGTLTSRYHFASSYIMMPFVPVLTDADAKRAQLVAELAAKKQAREEEDAAALKALEEQIAKEAAAAKKKEHDEALAAFRAEKRKAVLREEGIEVLDVSCYGIAVARANYFRRFTIRLATSVPRLARRCFVSGERTVTAVCAVRILGKGATSRRRRAGRSRERPMRSLRRC
jgi:hypothetical protein